jgi:hypothetical protein
MASTFAQTYTSFSGADLVVSFGPKTIGELQQISWGIKREKAPVFTLGSPDPRSFSRGKRGIGGSLVFAQFNRDALIEELVKDSNVWQNIAPVAMFSAKGNIANRGMEFFQDALKMASWNTSSSANQQMLDQGYGFQGQNAISPLTIDTASDGSGTQIRVPHGFGVIKANNIMYADMIPPFDVTLTFANEYGQAAFQKIYDLDILDESSGVSVDSIVMERQMSYVARRISPLMEGIYARESGGTMYGVDVQGNRIQ